MRASRGERDGVCRNLSPRRCLRGTEPCAAGKGREEELWLLQPLQGRADALGEAFVGLGFCPNDRAA